MHENTLINDFGVKKQIEIYPSAARRMSPLRYGVIKYQYKVKVFKKIRKYESSSETRSLKSKCTDNKT